MEERESGCVEVKSQLDLGDRHCSEYEAHWGLRARARGSEWGPRRTFRYVGGRFASEERLIHQSVWLLVDCFVVIVQYPYQKGQVQEDIQEGMREW